MVEKIQVLYVDDEQTLLELGKIFLELSGNFTVTTATSAPEAILMLEQERCDIIVSDYQMPEMDGIQFLFEVRKRFGPIPFILFTGRGREDVVIQAINSGADFYLQKGGDSKVQFAELSHKIKQAASRKKAEDSLRRSEEKYRHLIEHSDEAIVVVQDGMLRLVNHQAIEFSGYSEQELLSMPFLVLIHPDDRAMVMDRYQNQIKGEESLSHYSFRMNPKDGSIRWIESSISATDWDGKPATLNFLTDITARKRADEEAKRTQEELAASYEQITATEEALRQTLDQLTQHERNLRESEEKYRTVFENTGTANVVIEESNIISLANNSFAQLSGFTKDDIEGKKSWTEFVVKDDLERMLAQHRLRRQNREKALTHYEFQFITKSGEIRNIYLSIDIIPGTKKSIASLLDITEHKRVEQALADSEDRFRSLTENSLDTIMLFDRNLRHIYVNPITEKQTGISTETFIGKTHAELGFPPDLVDLWERTLKGVFTSGKTDRIEFELPHGIWIDWLIVPVKGSDGTVVNTITSARDITDRKRAEDALRRKNTELHAAYEQLTAGEEELRQSFDELSKKEQMVRESENNLKAILESLQNAIVIIDSKTHTIVDANSVAIKMIGAPREDIIGHVCHKYICPADVRKCPISDLNQTIDLSERILLTAKGEQVPILKSVTPKVISGHEYYIENLIDITERKRVEDAFALARKKLNLLSGITRHDILNQLTALRGYLELSREIVNDPVLSDYISKEEHIAEIIEQQIAFTRDYQDLGIHISVWQDVNATILTAMKMLPMRDVRVNIDRTDLEIFVDPLCDKVFFNLIDNALIHGGDAMTTIRIFSRESDRGLVIVCEDDGAGISAEDKKLLFTRGFGKHTGLGLFLSREILSITGITITETSELGKGARFEIFVPKGGFRIREKLPDRGNVNYENNRLS